MRLALLRVSAYNPIVSLSYGMALETLSPAKVNLALKVLGARSDGYHDLDMHNISVDFADSVRLEHTPGAALSINVTSDSGIPISSELNDPSKNLASRAVKLVCERMNVEPEFSIAITKRIPLGAGLAGGSSNAAAVLRLFDHFFQRDEAYLRIKNGLGNMDLSRLLGADIPFCLTVVPARVLGLGDRVHPTEEGAWQKTKVLLILPRIHCDTKKVFAEYSASKEQELAEFGECDVKSEEKGAPTLKNDLEAACRQAYPEVGVLLAQARSVSPLDVHLSGSGSSMFVIGSDSEVADARIQLADRLADKVAFAHCSVLTSQPPVIGQR